MSNSDPKSFNLQRMHLENERWRMWMEPLYQLRQSHLDHTVSYGQMVFRSLLLLNGGGLLAVPAFAEVFDGIWSRGTSWALVTIAAFAFGLISAALGVTCSFYSFLALQNDTSEGIKRAAKRLDLERTKELQQAEIDALEKPTQEEAAYEITARRWDFWAKVFGWSALVLFIVGAVGGFYIVSGAPPEGGAKYFFPA